MMPLFDALVKKRSECDAYALDMDSLRVSAGRVVDAATKAGHAARSLGVSEVAGQFDIMAAGIADTRDKLVQLHQAAVTLAGQVAQVTRDFELAVRKEKIKRRLTFVSHHLWCYKILKTTCAVIETYLPVRMRTACRLPQLNMTRDTW